MTLSTSARLNRLEKAVATAVRTCANDHTWCDVVSPYATPADVEAQRSKPYPAAPGTEANTCPMCGLPLVAIRVITDAPASAEEVRP